LAWLVVKEVVGVNQGVHEEKILGNKNKKKIVATTIRSNEKANSLFTCKKPSLGGNVKSSIWGGGNKKA